MRRVPIVLLCSALAAGCSGSGGTGADAPPLLASTARPDIVLPAGPLRELVPATADLPPGMVPLLAGSGSRDLAAVAGYSADPVAARRLLADHGFQAAYVAQYADPADGRVLSVVVSRFATVAGATADLTSDLAGSTGQVVDAAPIGDQSQVRRQPLPAASTAPGASAPPAGELVTVRFRRGATTWLLAYGAAPTADPALATALAATLAGRVPA